MQLEISIMRASEDENINYHIFHRKNYIQASTDRKTTKFTMYMYKKIIT